MAQGVLTGYVACEAFGTTSWKFWAIGVTNAVLIVLYGETKP